jgi:phosphohistidine phosphatase SixA
MMNFFILRHGQAEDYAASDAERKLTEVGRIQTRRIVQDQLSDLQAVTHLYSSPYVRAQQTAAIVAEELKLEVTTVQTIVPEGGIKSLVQLLSETASESRGQLPLIVSHQPLVGSFVNWICGLEYGYHSMGTSALAAIETDVIAQNCGDLKWLKQP